MYLRIRGKRELSLRSTNHAIGRHRFPNGLFNGGEGLEGTEHWGQKSLPPPEIPPKSQLPQRLFLQIEAVSSSRMRNTYLSLVKCCRSWSTTGALKHYAQLSLRYLKMRSSCELRVACHISKAPLTSLQTRVPLKCNLFSQKKHISPFCISCLKSTA